VAAGGLAAALSTAAGLLLVISAAISHDLMKGVLRPNMTEKQELFWARIAAGGAVIIAGYFGIYPPGFVAQVVAFAFGLAASSFFPVIIMGVFWKRATKEGAMWGMATGIVFTAAYIIYFKFMNPAANTLQNWWFGISPEGIGMIGMILNFAVLTGVSLVTKAPPKEVQDLVGNLRYPKESRRRRRAAGTRPNAERWCRAAVLRGGRPFYFVAGTLRAASFFRTTKPTSPAAFPMTRIWVMKFATAYRNPNAVRLPRAPR
jgi:Na+/proline symporter